MYNEVYYTNIHTVYNTHHITQNKKHTLYSAYYTLVLQYIIHYTTLHHSTNPD